MYFRLRLFCFSGSVADGYSVHFLGLSPTHVLKTPVLELGWFAMHPDQVNQDIFNMA